MGKPKAKEETIDWNEFWYAFEHLRVDWILGRISGRREGRVPGPTSTVGRVPR
jgi:hypothetical protein